MRDIRFRAWDKKHGGMFENPFLEQHHVYAHLDELFAAAQERYELMQFTGLQDKNGKDIYEGDVVVGSVGDDWVIEWFEGGFTLRCACHYPDGDFYDIREVGSYEVIGNIYSNPELLNG